LLETGKPPGGPFPLYASLFLCTAFVGSLSYGSFWPFLDPCRCVFSAWAQSKISFFSSVPPRMKLVRARTAACSNFIVRRKFYQLLLGWQVFSLSSGVLGSSGVELFLFFSSATFAFRYVLFCLPRLFSGRNRSRSDRWFPFAFPRSIPFSCQHWPRLRDFPADLPPPSRPMSAKKWVFDNLFFDVFSLETACGAFSGALGKIFASATSL